MYEVKQGSLAKNNTYTGVILRSETVTNAEKNGYINYYAKEGDKVGVGNTVYAIDESGKLSELLEENSEALDPSADEMKELREEVMNFTNQFSTDCFDDIYHFKSSLEKSVLKITTTNLSASVDILSSEYANLFSKGMAKEAGIPAYVVFSNATLTDMAKKKPKTMSEFRKVSGVGEIKAAWYGTAFLKRIQQYIDENEG